MKKILSFALALCFALLLSVPAFADGRGPAFTSYDVVCTKITPYFRENWDNDGAMEQQGTFPSGTTLTVEYEYEIDGVTYGWVTVGYGDSQEWYYIRVSDVELKSDVYLPENSQKLSRPHSVRVIVKGGITMYAGPNRKYKKVATVPRGTKLTYTYGNDEEEFFRTWAYVKYMGKSGWIYVLASDTKNGLVQLPDDDQKAEIWVLEDGVRMFDGISFGNIEEQFRGEWDEEYLAEMHEEPDRVIGTLEKSKKYTYRYYHAQNYGTWYNVTAGVRTGWVFMSNSNSSVAVAASAEDQDRRMAFRTFNLLLHDAPGSDANTTAVTVTEGTVLGAEYVTSEDYYEYCYTTINGQSGWYSYEDTSENTAYKLDESDYGHGYTTRNESESAAPIYSKITAAGKPVGKIPAGGIFKPLYYGGCPIDGGNTDSDYLWAYYVRYNDVTGWVLEKDLFGPDDEKLVEDEPGEEPDEWNENEDWDDEGWYDEDWDDENWDEEDWIDEDWEEETTEPEGNSTGIAGGLRPLHIILLCVGGAVVLALTATVTLLLIRRKRKARADSAAETNAEPNDK